MSEGSSPGEPRTPASGRRGKSAARAELRAQVQATRADFERQVLARKAQLDATNERIAARTGRNLILATLIGLVAGALLVVSLIFIKELFLVFGAAMIGFAAFELTQAFRGAGRRVPRTPSLIAALAIVPATFWFHAGGQLVALASGIVLVVVWRLVEEAVLPAKRPGEWRSPATSPGACSSRCT
jgi:hypothetical protein